MDQETEKLVPPAYKGRGTVLAPLSQLTLGQGILVLFSRRANLGSGTRCG